LSIARFQHWKEDPITQIFLEGIDSRITELYLSLVKIQYDENYHLKVAETKGKILELQTISSIESLKDMLDKHVEWES
jgi:hypothetical protein